MKSKNIILTSLATVFLFAGCNANKSVQLTPSSEIINKKSPLQIRDVQMKTFDNTSKSALINAMVDTILDDGYYVTVIDLDSGVLSAKNNKDGLEFNLVSLIKEVSKDSFLVRISINAVDRSVEPNQYVIIEDNTIYTYMFDRLRKSLFLEDNFYDKKHNQEPVIKEEVAQEIIDSTESIQNQIIELPTKQDTLIKTDLKQITSIDSSFYYTVQFISAVEEKSAKKVLDKVSQVNSDVRLEKLNKYHVVRLGKFDNHTEARELRNTLKEQFPEVIIVKVKI
jgi:hypothetical protein